DGDGQGVYGQFLTGDGSLAGSEFRVNNTTRGDQLFPALGTDAAGRFLATWGSFAGLRSGFDLFGRLCVSTNFVANTPAATNVFAPPPPEAFDDITLPDADDFNSPPIV